MAMLDGVRVVELALWGMTPRAGVLLADLGAEVIKIEPPSGDPIRGVRVLQGKLLPPMAVHPGVEVFDRNKKNICVDVKQEGGREIVYKLVTKADVFLTNLRVPALKKLGFDYDTVAKINPGIIYARGTGWGLKGPLQDQASYAPLSSAAVGLTGLTAEPEAPPPIDPPAEKDLYGGMTLAYGILAALFHRQRTGEGQLVHASLFGSAMDGAAMCLQVALLTGEDLPRVARKKVANPMVNTYRTRDGRWLLLCMTAYERWWPELCRALDIGHLKDDPRFSSLSAASQNSEALLSILEEIFSTKTLAEWEESLRQWDLAWSPIRNGSELATDPQALANEYVVDFDHPSAGPIKVVGPPVYFSKTPAKIKSPGPEAGQHTEEVLLELGYTWEEIGNLKDQMAII